MRPDTKRTLRTFGLGGAVGFIAGALLATIIVWHAAPGPRAATRPPSTDRWQDGMGEIGPAPDAPVPAGDGRTNSAAETPAATSGHVIEATPSPTDEAAVRELEDRDLDIPVEGVKEKDLTRTFNDARGGNRIHEALDILAPRNTPVKAVEDGRIVKLFNSKAGGITVYQFDPSERYCYYYAHLERYADGLREGDRVSKGQLLGYVGTSGNAPKDTPHLHFAVFRLNADRKWWEGTPIDPYDILR
ncbi:MAG TPA: M23 family metallopeptidase [Vicinamibacterales bacterium]